jgi:hypothetical protein
VVKFKAYKQAANGPSPALLAKLTAALAVRGEEEIGQLLDQAALQPSTGARLADDQKAATMKAERNMGLNPHGLRSDTGRLIGAPIRDPKTGRPLS